MVTNQAPTPSPTFDLSTALTFGAVAFLPHVVLSRRHDLPQQVQHGELDRRRLPGHHESVEDAEQLHAQSLEGGHRPGQDLVLSKSLVHNKETLRPESLIWVLTWIQVQSQTLLDSLCV